MLPPDRERDHPRRRELESCRWRAKLHGVRHAQRLRQLELWIELDGHMHCVLERQR